MAIITISRGTFSGGQRLAENVAERLGYRCISREVLVEAARDHGVPLDRLSKALSDVPGILEHMGLERVHYLAYIREAMVNEVKDEKVVYHGHAGHILLRGVPHVLKVRVIASMEFRIQAAKDRMKFSEDQAIEFITKVDEKRIKWTKFLYHVDWNDPALYDMVINLDHIKLSSAGEIVCQAAGLEEFALTPESQRIMDDLVISTEVRAAIAADGSIGDGGIEVEADGGVVTIGGTVGSLEEADRVRDLVRHMPNVKDIESHMRVGPFWGVERY